MSPRLKSVIAKLYRPSLAHGRQVFAISRSEAEQLPRLPSIAVVSITSPDKPPASLAGFEHLLRLQFEDVDFLNPELSKRAQEKLEHAFTTEQAGLIRSFIEGLPASVHSVVVHCEGGYSRSCAVAQSLHRLYGYEVEMDRLQQANPSVMQLLAQNTTASNKRKK